MPTRVALDTNVLAYAEGLDHSPGDAAKGALSLALVAGFGRASQRPVLATQALAELHRLLIRIARYSPARASLAVRSWQTTSETALVSAEGFEAALTLAADHKLQIFDALIMAAAVMATVWSPIPPRWKGSWPPGGVNDAARPERAQYAAMS